MVSRVDTVSEASSFERSFRANSVISASSPLRSPSFKHNKGKSKEIQRRLIQKGIDGNTTGEIN